VGPRQHTCSKSECQTARRKKTQANWRAKNPEYAAGYRIQQRGAREQPPEPLRLPPPLRQLPWDLAKDEFGQKALISLGLWDHFWCVRRKTSSARIPLIPQEFPTHFPLRPKKTSSSLLHTDRDAKE